MDPLQPIIDQVTQTTSVEGSAVTLLNQLSAMLAAAANDPAKIQQIAANLKTSADALAQAITANTPVTPAQAKQKK